MSVLKETAVWSRDFSLNKQWLPDCALRRKRLNASDVRFLDVFSGSACSWQLHEIQNIVKMIRDYSRWLLHVRLFCVVRMRNLTSEEEVDELCFPEDELFFLIYKPGLPEAIIFVLGFNLKPSKKKKKKNTHENEIICLKHLSKLFRFLWAGSEPSLWLSE